MTFGKIVRLGTHEFVRYGDENPKLWRPLTFAILWIGGWDLYHSSSSRRELFKNGSFDPQRINIDWDRPPERWWPNVGPDRVFPTKPSQTSNSFSVISFQNFEVGPSRIILESWNQSIPLVLVVPELFLTTLKISSLTPQMMMSLDGCYYILSLRSVV